MADTRYLERVAGEKWRVTVAVPRNLHKALGKTALKRSLGTDSLVEANRMKWSVVAELKAEIEAARNPHKAPPLAKDIELALEMRERLRNQHSVKSYGLEPLEEIEMTAEGILGEPVDQDRDGELVYDAERERRAAQFRAIATGRQTPLVDALPKFHAQGQWNPRTRADSDRAVKYLADWCERNEIPQTIEAVTRRRAGEFIGSLIDGTKTDARTGPLTNKTANKYISCLSGYWGWMIKRGYLDENANAWERQHLPKQKTSEDEKERPFTGDEITRLMSGQPLQPYMKPLMMIAALTGARIGAIVALTVADTTDGCFRFLPQKKEKSSRLVPIHPDLVPVITLLMKDRKPSDDLFPECPRLPTDDVRERSMPAVKAFGRYREKVGVVDVVEGKRRGLVNFHSFRRWFITEAERAGIAPHIIAAVVGHNKGREGMTLSVYSGGPSIEQLRACVEAVKLPFRD